MEFSFALSSCHYSMQLYVLVSSCWHWNYRNRNGLDFQPNQDKILRQRPVSHPLKISSFSEICHIGLVPVRCPNHRFLKLQFDLKDVPLQERKKPEGSRRYWMRYKRLVCGRVGHAEFSLSCLLFRRNLLGGFKTKKPR